ncbi:hypothetical protein [Nocardioides bigeumensis]|uniref:Uncharacterized protein n=1 Tax=Nocardioides bigeumensis TaxID=433657 RepID=A0ABP5KB03_9ACTN
MTRLRATVAAPLLVLALGLLSACSGSSDDGDTATDPAGSGGAGSGASAGEMPTSVPPPTSDVVGVGTVMDLGQGEDPQLCLGAVAESYPPQCSGIPITNWDWKPVKDTSEASGTVRWGSYAVTGAYDGKTFEVTQEPMSSALYDPMPADNPFVTTCEEPAGGWAVVDESKVGFEDQDAVYAAAAQLPNYAGSFLDMNADKPDDASATIVNVLVTDDPEGAEKALREVWGGPLCVTVAEHTEAELVEIQDGLTGLPGLLSSGPQLDKLVVDVVWDDGTLQSWADATYGEGLVAMRSVLQPVG